jgi:hypothetical protein
VSAVALALVGISGVWAQDKYVATADEELYGKWTNRSTAQDVWHPQKSIFESDGFKAFISMADSVPYEEATVVIDRKWVDEDGAIYYRYFGNWTSGYFKGQKFQVLAKITDSASTFESVSKSIGLGPFDSGRFPTTIDPKDPTYQVLYRVQE